MLDAAAFREIYRLLDEDQTVDDDGCAVDCGVRCHKHCCSPQISKYLLPGERAFLEREGEGREPFGFTSSGFFDTFIGMPSTRACACEPARNLRPFNCRVFPYGAKVVERRVVDLVKGKQSYLEPCWIETPGAKWQEGALRAWQIVLDDNDTRKLFARLTTLWEWNRALERGEEPGHVLVALTVLEHANDGELWARAARFFGRAD
jgi:hypothetical protein